MPETSVASYRPLRYIEPMVFRNLYDAAHVFVAGVRVYEHLNRRPPSLKELADMLGISEEELSLVSRKLCDEKIVSAIISGADCRYGIGDYTRIEALPRDSEAPRMMQEITQFQTRQQSRLKDIEKSLSENKDKQRVFSDLEKALKDPASLQKKKNPLD